MLFRPAALWSVGHAALTHKNSTTMKAMFRILAALFLGLPASILSVSAQDPYTLKQAIPPPTASPQSGGQLGYSVAVEGGYTVVGVPFDNTGGNRAGVAKVFDSTSGALLFVLLNPRPADLSFGISVAISGTRVVVGAYSESTGTINAGSAYVYDLSSGTPTQPVTTLNNPSPAVGDDFGLSVAISGTRVVVGAPRDDTGATNAGSAYVYDLTSGTPTVPVASLSISVANASLGKSLAISGTNVVVGAPDDSSTGVPNGGRVYVYNMSSGTPTVPVATLNKPSPADYDYFGYSVTISDTRVVVGAPYTDTGASGAGSAYVYDLASGTPTVPVVTLNNPDPSSGDLFGASVAISSTRVVVGVPYKEGGVFASGILYNAGRAYAYDLSNGTPSVPVATLNNPSPVDDDFFSYSVAISGTRVVVGAPSDDTGATNAGSAYVYDLGSGTPTAPVASLNNPGPSTGDKFGTSVAISGRWMVVGAMWDKTGARRSGSAYVYDLASATPTVAVATLNNPNPAEDDYFGYSVAISGTRVVIGTPLNDTGGVDAGSAYVYDLASITPTVPVATLRNPGAFPGKSKANGQFGSSVAISGGVVVVGVPNDSGFNAYAGLAHVYDLDSGSPTVPVARLNHPSPSQYDNFGSSVAISGIRVVVGILGDETDAQAATYGQNANTGSAYVYELGNWTVPIAILNNPGQSLGASFGYSVAISGTRVLVGSPYESVNNAGRAYVYDLNSGTPTVPIVTMNNPSPVLEDRFGTSVSISGTRAVVGDYHDDTTASDAGSAYVYDLTIGTPSVPVTTLNNPSPAVGDEFGTSVAIDGPNIIVGTPNDDTVMFDKGFAYVFTTDTTTLVPSLSAPVLTNGSMSVSFNLPEPALAGSVMLTFTGTATRVLTLADTQETSGAHSFSFNPANPTASAQIVSGNPIPDDTYSVTLSYRDASGNPAGSAVSIGVMIDTTAPVVAAHANVIAEATSAAGALVNYTAGSATDAVGVTSLTYSQNSGTTFPIGTTTLTITARDAANNTGTGTFTVTVVDTTAPVVAAHADVIAEATSAAGAVVTYAAGSATDAVGVTSLTYSKNSGTTFGIGTTTVTITAKDAANKQGTRTFTVTVRDTTAPVVAAHANVSVMATSLAGATVSYAAGSATDAVGATSLTYSKNSGTTFPIGTTTVTITAKDAANNTGTGTFTVTVTNNAPVVTLVGANPLTFEAAATYGDPGATATDVEDGTLTPSITSSTVVPNVPGIYAVTWSATDSANATGSATRVVNVVDTIAPVVAPHANETVEATSAAGAVVTYAAGSATDAVGVTSLTYSKNSGTTFGIGTTTVTITAKDAANKQGTRTFTVTVRDTTAPVVAAHANVSVMATSLAGATVSYAAGSATDAVGATSLTYSKNSGTTFPIGTTTVTITAKDAVNNTGTGTFTVTVIAWAEVDGTYQALLQHDNSASPDEPLFPGRITVSLNKLGVMTGKLQYRGLTYSFTGKLTPQLNYQRTILQKNQGSLTLSIYFDPSALTLNAQLSEFIQSGNILSDATMLLHSFDASKNPAPQAGRYTMRIKNGTTSNGGPDAPGYALATISKSGVMKITGKMSDGSALSCSAFLNEDGSSAFYDPLYKAAYPYAGYLAGAMSFDPAAGLQAVTGNLEWQKPAQTKGVFWPQGFRQTRDLEGSVYIPPLRNQRALNLTDLSGAMTFTASGPASFTNNFLLTTANRFLLVDLPNTRKLALKFVPVTGLATGLTTGSFYDSTLRKTRKLQGVVLQAQGEINGYLLGDTDAGEWTLSPP